MDLYNSLYSNRPGTEGTPVGVRPIEEIGSGSGEAGVEPYQPFGHGAGSPGLVERAPTNEGGSGTGSGDGAYIDGLPREEYIRQSGYYSLLAQRQRVRATAHDTNVADVIRKNHWFLLTDLNAQISAIEDKLGKATGIGREPYKNYSFETKLGGALRRAIDSGDMDDAIAQKLEEVVSPASLAILAASVSAYAALHGTPAAPFLLVADVGFTAAGGAETLLAMQRIYLAVDGATTEQEMDAAAETIVAELSGPAADAILNMLLWGAGRGVGKLADRLEVDPTTFGMGGGNIRFRRADPNLLIAALGNFRGKYYKIGDQPIQLEKAAMRHILERHHPTYWDGSTKSQQSFFGKRMAASDVVNVIDQIMKLKGGEIKNLDNGTGQVTATIDDVTYTLGMINWKIGQLYSE